MREKESGEVLSGFDQTAERAGMHGSNSICCYGIGPNPVGRRMRAKSALGTPDF